uniref:NADH dehydrogenase subunit 2 n=1 Tax=Hodotermes mossambicus TaxID=187541 RepID=UPI002551D8CC|nr:NADH dehydrogenase subunit 2 [Hodotermes mossambicus]UYX57317.1 NADH dehydrogenase subunit 2 [Hodotermes mossambicus]
MSNNSTKILLLTTLMSGIMISISSNSWFGAWMGLEVNLLSFIPLMMNQNNIYTTESSIKYFIVQAAASSSLLFLVLTKTMMENMTPMPESNFSSIIINTPLLLKSGAAPFHWWFPGVMEGLDWSNCLLLMTVQKMAPLMLISYQTSTQMPFMTTIILMSAIVGAIGGMNQTSLRKIMTYSSINHTGWMLAAMTISENLWIMYFAIYSLLTTTVVTIIKPFNLSFINQVMMTNKKNVTAKIMMFMTLLSLGGLPPFLGFLPKWITIQAMINNNMMSIATIMVIMSVMTLYYYLRICYSSFMILHDEPNWNTKSHMNNKMTNYSMILSAISTMGLAACTMMINTL